MHASENYILLDMSALSFSKIFSDGGNSKEEEYLAASNFLLMSASTPPYLSERLCPST